MGVKTGKPLFREALTSDVEERLGGIETKNGATLFHIIRSGMENPDSSIGCYAADGESYDAFADLFDPVIEKYHGLSRGVVHRNRLQDETVSMDGLAGGSGRIISTRIRVGRNLAGYPFPSLIAPKDRLAVERKIVDVLETFTGELKGRYHPLEGMGERIRERLVREHLLFKKGDRFLESAGINRDWPEGRGIFISEDRKFLVWVNEEDHLRIISMEQGGDIPGVFRRLVRAALLLERELEFAFSPRLGYLSSCPTNLGTSMRASVHIRLPHLSKRENFKERCRELGLSVRGTDGEHSVVREGIYDISNSRRLGRSEAEIVSDLVSGLGKLMAMEKSSV